MPTLFFATGVTGLTAVEGNSGDGVRDSELVCLLNAEIVQGVGSSGEVLREMEDSVRDAGRCPLVLREPKTDSVLEAVDPALSRPSDTPNEEDALLFVGRVVEIRLDGRCSFSVIELGDLVSCLTVLFLRAPRVSTVTVEQRVSYYYDEKMILCVKLT